MSLHKKYFIHYYRVSVSEGLQTELSTSELMLRKFDDKIFQTCHFRHCRLKLKGLLLKKLIPAIIA